MSIQAIRPSNYREQVFFRQLRVRVKGSSLIEHGLTQIRGVGRRFAQAVINVAGIDPRMRVGVIPEKDLLRIEEIVLNPIKNGIPEWMVNRKKDLRTGENLHLIGNHLDITTRRDIDRMKRIKSYRGVRHHLHLKVRGQRTKSTGRHGLVVGVIRTRKRGAE